jgi:hypothetical protein
LSAFRSWTDPVTNVTVLADVTLEDDLGSLLEWGHAPEALLPAFLHEATHHWCFNTAVGNTLGILAGRVRTAAARWIIQDRRDDSLVRPLVDRLNRVETALTLLRPLAEGLALFAEFDINSREGSRAFSVPLELASVFFARRVPQADSIPSDRWLSTLIVQALQPMRFGEQALRRKVSVLGQPLTCTGEAYLPGYLLVKQLWLNALSRVPRFLNETDLFIMYLHSYIYSDLGLVAELLDTTTDEFRGSEAVANRMMRRLADFEDVTSADVESYEQVVESSGPAGLDSRLLQSALRVSDADVARCDECVHSVQDEVVATGQTELDDAMRFHEYQIARRRELLYIGSWPADIEISGRRFRVLNGGRVVREGTADEGVERQSGQGLVDLFYWHAHRARVCALSIGGKLVAREYLAVQDFDDDEGVLELAVERDETRERTLELDRMLEHVLDATGGDVLRDQVRRSLARQIDAAYLSAALGGTKLDRVPATALAMRERGFFPLLRRERRAIEGFASLGLYASMMPQEVLMRGLLEARGIDLDATLGAVDRMVVEYDVGHVRRGGGCLLPTV